MTCRNNSATIFVTEVSSQSTYTEHERRRILSRFNILRDTSLNTRRAFARTAAKHPGGLASGSVSDLVRLIQGLEEKKQNKLVSLKRSQLFAILVYK